MLKNIIIHHVFPIFIAIGIAALSVLLVKKIPRPNQQTETVFIKGSQLKHRGKYANLLKDSQAEIDLFASIKKPNQLTIFGSSELSLSNYASYHFLPDSMGIPTMGFGHAYHQNLSILIELLASKKHVKNSKICIILSPGWFETEGTNIEAFIEFAQPNLLQRIWSDSTISDSYKIKIGEYINDHYQYINGVSGTMENFRNLYVHHKGNRFQKALMWVRESCIPYRKNRVINEDITITNDSLTPKPNRDFTPLKTSLQKEFLDGITNNEIFVTNNYYATFIAQSDGGFNTQEIKQISIERSNEFRDFKLLLKFLSENEVKASFIMQPYNPFYYSGVEKYNTQIKLISKEITNHGFPYLNMYVSNKDEYIPATLKDVMHLGDYGWMTINEYLISVYNE